MSEIEKIKEQGKTVKEEPFGVLCVDKACGFTSHDVVNRIRKLYMTKKVGHTGTLDPMATGVLVILIGRAAKAAEFLMADEKKYEAKMKLGVVTDSQDITGNVVSESDFTPDENQVYRAVEKFTGDILQTPPMYSALKVNGQKLVDLARKGKTVDRKEREIRIHSLKAERITETEYSLKVHCSKGTYIRTLCHDIGRELSCGAVMSALRRTESGNFSVKDAVTLEELEAMSMEERLSKLCDVEKLFLSLPLCRLSDFYARLAHSGAQIYQKKIKTDFMVGQRVRVYDAKGFFGIGEVRQYDDETAIKVLKQFVL